MLVGDDYVYCMVDGKIELCRKSDKGDGIQCGAFVSERIAEAFDEYDKMVKEAGLPKSPLKYDSNREIMELTKQAFLLCFGLVHRQPDIILNAGGFINLFDFEAWGKDVIQERKEQS